MRFVGDIARYATIESNASEPPAVASGGICSVVEFQRSTARIHHPTRAARAGPGPQAVLTSNL
jgi:hypothetical protein